MFRCILKIFVHFFIQYIYILLKLLWSQPGCISEFPHTMNNSYSLIQWHLHVRLQTRIISINEVNIFLFIFLLTVQRSKWTTVAKMAEVTLKPFWKKKIPEVPGSRINCRKHWWHWLLNFTNINSPFSPVNYFISMKYKWSNDPKDNKMSPFYDIEINAINGNKFAEWRWLIKKEGGSEWRNMLGRCFPKESWRDKKWGEGEGNTEEGNTLQLSHNVKIIEGVECCGCAGIYGCVAIAVANGNRLGCELYQTLELAWNNWTEWNSW